MEQAPKDNSDPTYPSELLENKNDEKKYLFDAKILRGRESFDAIAATLSKESRAALPNYDNMHTKQKLLLSYIEPHSDILPSAQIPQIGLATHRTATLDMHGLKIEGKTFEYNPNFRVKLHREYIDRIVDGAENNEEFHTRLASANSEFRGFLRDRARPSVRSEIQKEYDAKNAELQAAYKERNQNVSMRSLRSDLISSIRPDLDMDAVKTATVDTEKVQATYKNQLRDLAFHNGHFKRSSFSIDKAMVDIQKGQVILKRREKRLEKAQSEYDTLLANNADPSKIKEAKRQLDYRQKLVAEKKEQLERTAQKKTDNISTSDSGDIKAMNRLFADIDLSILKYSTLRQLSEIKQQPANSPEIAQLMRRIKNNEIEEGNEIYQVATKYHLSADEIKNRNYIKELSGENSIVDFNTLSEELEQKQRIDFIHRNQLFNQLGEEDSKKILDCNFAAEYERRKKAYAMEHGNLSSEEYDDIQRNKISRFNYGRIAHRPTGQLKQDYLSYNNEISNECSENLDYAIHVLHLAVLNDISRELGEEGKLRAPKEVQVRVFDGFRKTDTQFLKDKEAAIVKQISDSLKKDLDIENAKEQILEILAPENDEQSDNYADILNRAIADMRKHINASVKYYDALARFGTNLCQDDREALCNDQKKLAAEKEATLEHLPEDRVLAETEKEMRTFSHSLFGESIDECFVYPTGFVVIDKNGEYQAIPVDTSSDRVASHIDDRYRDMWRSYLRSDEISGPHGKQSVLSIVNHIVEKEFEENLDYATEDERDVVKFCQELQLDSIPVTGSTSGAFNEQLSGLDCDSARHCLSRFGRYIGEINITTSSTDQVHRESLVSSIKEFLASGSRIGTGFYGGAQDNERHLSVKGYTAIANELGSDVADSLLINSISSGVYSKNEKNLESILRKILGDKLNISIITAMRLTGKKIMSPETRQKVAMRAIFTSHYNRYLRGEEINNPQLAQLIKRVDHIEYSSSE